MSIELNEADRFADHPRSSRAAFALRKLHLDGPLLVGLIAICAMGLFVLYSAAGQRTDLLIAQLVRLSIAFVALAIVAQISPAIMRRWTPWGFLLGLVLLILVLFLGEVGQGAIMGTASFMISEG